MLNKIKILKGYRLDSLDGEIGKSKNSTLMIRTGQFATWLLTQEIGLSDRQVLISPHALLAVNKEEQNIAINLTKKQIEDSPPLESDKPVSRQYEKSLPYVLWLADVLGGWIPVGTLSLHRA